MKTQEEIITSLRHTVMENAALDYDDKLERLMKRCESPIERILLAAMLVYTPEGIRILSSNEPLSLSLLMHGEEESGVDWLGAIYTQIELGSYRADFYMEAFGVYTKKRWFRAVIECDGHDFHERTKEQAARDKLRDRWFQTHGIAAIRFAGSEIWADPLGCADQAFEVFWSAAKRWGGR